MLQRFKNTLYDAMSMLIVLALLIALVFFGYQVGRTLEANAQEPWRYPCQEDEFFTPFHPANTGPCIHVDTISNNVIIDALADCGNGKIIGFDYGWTDKVICEQ